MLYIIGVILYTYVIDRVDGCILKLGKNLQMTVKVCIDDVMLNYSNNYQYNINIQYELSFPRNS